MSARNASGAELRIKAAGFPARKTLEDFDWDAQPAARQQLAALASGGFLLEGRNVVLLGPPGRPGWLAAVDPAADDVMTWAAVERAEPTVPPGEGELVWGPAAGSRSPLYPLRVSGDELVGLDGRPVRPRPGRG